VDHPGQNRLKSRISRFLIELARFLHVANRVPKLFGMIVAVTPANVVPKLREDIPTLQIVSF